MKGDKTMIKEKIRLKDYLLNNKILILDLIVNNEKEKNLQLKLHKEETLKNELRIINDIINICEERGRY